MNQSFRSYNSQSGQVNSPVVALCAIVLSLTLALTSLAAVQMDVRMNQAQIDKLGQKYGPQAKKTSAGLAKTDG